MREAFAVTLIVSFVSSSVGACSGVNLRSDVFLSKPVWESGSSDRLNPKGRSPAPEYATQEAALGSTPALVALLKEAGLVDEAKSAKAAAPDTVVVRDAAGSSVTLDVSSPLPSALAKSNAVKAMLMTARESVMHARAQGYSGQLPDPRISLGDFKDLITAVNSTALMPYRETGTSLVRVGTNLTWQWLLQKYFGAYFNGRFIDRAGAVTSKAKLSNTITDADITGLEHVFLESVWDWIIIGSNIKAPILYSGTAATPTFLIANPSNVPTLVTALESVGLTLPITRVVELASQDDQAPGLSKVKLCLIRSASGAAGSAAEGTSGIIVRALGGANLGLSFGAGVLGKISVGDNNLLTQMVDTWTESTGQRSTEIFASELLYGVSLPTATSEFCGS